ncbi:hypothetical protein EDB81DRAFT_897224 [Dactylonectria macrodidyma]|uniref:Kelch repeat-containing protein n=1 Tax=Dactylonectria macrodidyma TaxID=307937 RepID=A0A9P9FV88_9HYPO|nr:hypothetical protein EDB81DRAFT_897224 [Dactylonectria macrodidyma]
MPPMHTNLTKNASIPSVHGGALWADDVNYRLFLFGGEFYSDDPTTLSLMSYDIWYDQWDDFGPPRAGIQRVSYGASMSVMERGEWYGSLNRYYYGGYLSNASVSDWSGRPRATSDLIRYEMDGNSWSKLAGPDDIRRAEGVMTFIPASDGGMLVYFGGVQDPHHNGTMIPQPMEQIFLYDMISNKRFCAGAVWAKDRSSYNIYLNAGLSFGGYGFDDVYVLSLPSFTWIKIYPVDRNGTGEYPSHSLSCNIVNEVSQMLTIGGSFPSDNTCDSESVLGVHNVDLGNQIKGNFKKVWAEYIPTLVGYKVPQFVTRVIGGTEDGGATKTTPDAGFADHDISILLGMKAVLPTRTRANDGRNDPTTAKPGLSQSAIIGIAVGGGANHKRKSNARSVAPTKPHVQSPPTPLSFGPCHYTQSPESGQRMSPRRWEWDGQSPDHNRGLRSSPANSPPGEMDSPGVRIAELDVGN